MDLSKELIKARKISGHNIPIAAVQMEVSITTLVNLENGKIPKSPFIRKAIEDYINRWFATKQTKTITKSTRSKKK